jgi:hypothetical protein
MNGIRRCPAAPEPCAVPSRAKARAGRARELEATGGLPDRPTDRLLGYSLTSACSASGCISSGRDVAS